MHLATWSVHDSGRELAFRWAGDGHGDGISALTMQIQIEGCDFASSEVPHALASDHSRFIGTHAGGVVV